jgi:O-glycosyl hydrolase
MTDATFCKAIVRSALAIFLILTGLLSDSRAQLNEAGPKILVDPQRPRQVIMGLGVNPFENDPAFSQMPRDLGRAWFEIDQLATSWVRMGMPFKAWNPEPGRYDKQGVAGRYFELMRDINVTRKLPLTIGIWDCPDFMKQNPEAKHRFRLLPESHEAFAKAVTDWLIEARDSYGVTVHSLAVNEPDFGSRIRLSPEENAALSIRMARSFREAGLPTTLLIADAAGTWPKRVEQIGFSPLDYAKQVWAEIERLGATEYFGFLSIHSYNTTVEDQRQIAAFAEQIGRPLLVGEAGYRTREFELDRQAWDYAANWADHWHRLLYEGRNNVVLNWFGLVRFQDGVVQPRAQYWVHKRIFEHLPPGSHILETASSHPAVQAMAGRHEQRDQWVVFIHHKGDQEAVVQIEGLPSGTWAHVRSSGTPENPVAEQDVVVGQLEGQPGHPLEVRLIPHSFNTVYSRTKGGD